MNVVVHVPGLYTAYLDISCPTIVIRDRFILGRLSILYYIPFTSGAINQKIQKIKMHSYIDAICIVAQKNSSPWDISIIIVFSSFSTSYKCIRCVCVIYSRAGSLVRSILHCFRDSFQSLVVELFPTSQPSAHVNNNSCRKHDKPRTGFIILWTYLDENWQLPSLPSVQSDCKHNEYIYKHVN